MLTEQKFFICKHCGNLTGLIKDAGVKMVCCNEPMTELIANTVDASKEKHVPVVSISRDTIIVTIGSVLHPMIQEHHIVWVYLQTENGGQRKSFNLNQEPSAVFKLSKGEKAVKVFAYCNLHGLWSCGINEQ